jgi:lipid-A-disaccharide synthase
MQKPQIKALIVAGESSGDNHAAKLVTALRELAPEAQFYGSAGPKMRAVGVQPTVKADDLSIVGLIEIARSLPIFIRAMRALRTATQTEHPDVAILVDFPDFNLKLAKHLKREGVPVVYYISPQLWAWRQYRISSIIKYVDLLITILPFEKAWYEARGVTHVEYVGSPLAREVFASETRDEFFDRHGLDNSRKLIALLPGSRAKEISRILPTMLHVAEDMADAQFVVAVNKELRTEYRIPPNTKVVRDETYNALAASDAAAVTSGTATLEAGLLGTPMCVVYRTSRVNYGLFEPMIDVPHYGLINLIAEERLCTELIQGNCTALSIKSELERLLEPDLNKRMRQDLKAVADKLGHGGASKRAAEAILTLMTKKES